MFAPCSFDEQVHIAVLALACLRDPSRVLLQEQLPDVDIEVEPAAYGGDRRA